MALSLIKISSKQALWYNSKQINSVTLVSIPRLNYFVQMSLMLVGKGLKGHNFRYLTSLPKPYSHKV
uniref:Uncharacterized protein n=1 Tax=Octopus bimaculoides TaxID=37653 RepID=A0A0L8GQP5_OCTBM